MPEEPELLLKQKLKLEEAMPAVKEEPEDAAAVSEHEDVPPVATH